MKKTAFKGPQRTTGFRSITQPVDQETRSIAPTINQGAGSGVPTGATRLRNRSQGTPQPKPATTPQNESHQARLARALLRNRKIANRGRSDCMTGKCTLINRDQGTQDGFSLPKDGWYHIAPKGQFTHRESGTEQLLDEQAMGAMLNAFRKASKEPNFPGVLVDFDHFSLDVNHESRAAGWITAMQNRPNGLWARIRWSKTGREAVENGDYRLVSPVWLRDEMEDAGNGRLRPLRLDSLALTNDPNLKGMVPLSNDNRSVEPNCGASKPVRNQNTMDYRTMLLSLLGLPPEATDEQVQAAVDGTMSNMAQQQKPTPPKTDPKELEYPTANMATPGEEEDPNKVMNSEDDPTDEEIANMDDEEKDEYVNRLRNRNSGMLNELVERDLKDYESVIGDPQEMRRQLLANRTGTIKLLKAIKAKKPTTKANRPAPVYNREQRPAAPELTKDQASTQATTNANKIANRAKELQASLRVPYRRAFAMAQKEVVEQI